MEYFIHGDGDLIRPSVIQIESPGFSATSSGVAENPAAIRINDQSCSGIVCDVDRVTGIAKGIHILPFSSTVDFGIYSETQIGRAHV
jgi:hypothetical protein